MKQKMVMIVMLAGLIVGLCGVLSGGAAFAQTAPDRGTDDPSVNNGTGSNESSDQSTNQGAECEGEDCCGDVKTSIIKNSSICNASGEGGMILAILKEVLKFLTAGVGIAAVGGIGYGALLYTTAESKPEQTKKAIGIITNVVIGIAAYALMYVFLNFLIPGGIFS
jgi:hypothetical protein